MEVVEVIEMLANRNFGVLALMALGTRVVIVENVPFKPTPVIHFIESGLLHSHVGLVEVFGWYDLFICV